MGKTNWKKQVSNQQQVKGNNMSLVLSIINYYESISRAEIANKTSLSPTTVSCLTEQLLEKKLIYESGNGDTGSVGRKPIMLQVSRTGGYIVSIELLVDGFGCFLYNLMLEEVSGKIYPVANYCDIGKQIIDTIASLLAENQTMTERLFGICIGIPGIIDYQKNRVLSSTVIPIDNNNNFFDQIKDAYPKTQLVIGNESSYCAYAEKAFGNYGDISHLIYIDVNTGVGAGIVVDNKIFTGSTGNAGEIGHTSIDIHGQRCKCGNRGCLEMTVSIPAIIGKIITSLISGKKSVLSDMIGHDYNQLDLPLLARALDMGDELTSEIVIETADYMAVGINNIINLFNPQLVLIGGKISVFGSQFLDRVKERLISISLKSDIETIIRYSKLNDHVVPLGGAKYILDNILDLARCLEQI